MSDKNKNDYGTHKETADKAETTLNGSGNSSNTSSGTKK